VLVLYSGLGQTGLSCRLVGPNAGVVPTCNNMARGILLERNVGAARVAQQADARRQQQEALASANADGAAWAASVKAQQEAAAAEEAARQAAHDARAAEEREALSRMRQRDRQEADARDAAAAAERQRVAAEEAARAASAAVLATLVNESHDCLVTIRSTDAYVSLNSRARCVNQSMSFVGENWDNDIEVIRFGNLHGFSRLVVTLYEDPNFRGRSARLVCGNYELIGDVENEVSSLKIEILPANVNCRDIPYDQEVHDWDQ
jgi:membrane protein involved in colicin uptake